MGHEVRPRPPAPRPRRGAAPQGIELAPCGLSYCLRRCSRHVNYLFELLATYTWAPLIQFEYLMPFSYSIFLTILLLHRIARDEERCHLKYGKPYEEYCRRVPYRLIPGVI